MSGLFWWSAVSSVIFLPSTVPPKSAIAILMASTPPAPMTSAYTPGHVIEVADHDFVAGGERRALRHHGQECGERCRA